MGAPYVASNTRLAYANEGSFGVRPVALGGSGGDASLSILGKFNGDVGMPDAVVNVRKYYSFGAGRSWKRIQPAHIDRAGKLPLILENGRILGMAMGVDSFAGGSPNVHTLTPASRAILPSFSLAALMRDDANTRPFQRVFLGTVVEEAAFSVAKEEELQCELSILSKTVEDEDTASPTQINPVFNGYTDTAGRPYMWHDSSVSITASDGTKRLARVDSMAMGIKNNLSTKRYLVDSKGQEPAEFLTARPDFTLGFDFVPAGFLSSHTGTYTYSDGAQTTREALYDLLELGDDSAHPDITITVRLAKAGNLDDSSTFTFDDCVLSEAKHDWKLDGNEVVVPAKVEPRTMTITVRDALGQYVV